MKQKHLLISVFIILLLGSLGCKEHQKEKTAQEALIVRPYMELPDTVSLSGEWLEGIIYNTTNVNMKFGDEYKITYKDGNDWKALRSTSDDSKHIGFNLLAYHLPAGGDNQFQVYLYKDLFDYKEGEYRIVKNLLLSMTVEFYVTKDEIVEQQDTQTKRMEGKNFDLYTTQDTISVSADTIKLWFNNNSDVYIYPFENNFIECYHNQEERWMDATSAGYTGKHEGEIEPNSTVSFDVPLKASKIKEGRYRIRKLMETPIGKEFVLIH